MNNDNLKLEAEYYSAINRVDKLVSAAARRGDPAEADRLQSVRNSGNLGLLRAEVARANVLAWQEAKQERARRQKTATEARQFRANFGKVGLAFPKGFHVA